MSHRKPTGTSQGHKVIRMADGISRMSSPHPFQGCHLKFLRMTRSPGTVWSRGSSCESAHLSSSSSFFSTTRVSVVSSREAMEAALASAERVTFTGSMTPASMRFS